MSQEDFNEWMNRRNLWYVEHYYPVIDKGLKEGKSPKVIAKEMAEQGYSGISSNRIGVGDVSRIIELQLRSNSN